MTLRELYPEIEPYFTTRLRVSEVHEIYVEQCGNPKGQPILFVHGGPGGGGHRAARRYFDPERYRIINFDQRGCGESTPHACLQDNTTWHLISDIERIRAELNIDRWVVFGGSWGSTLSLSYAQKHPDRVKALVLRGIFLLRPKELNWFYQEGASFLFPEAWEQYLAPIPESERGDLLSAYYKRLTGSDPEERLRAARAWSIWEGSTSKLHPDAARIAKTGADQFAEAFARIECHYFKHGGFFDEPEHLLNGIDAIRHIPTYITQGRYDVVCPMVSAWELHRAFPEAEFEVVADAGHSASEPGLVDRLIRATDRFANLD